VLAQRLRVAADDPGDVDLRDTQTRQGPHPLTHRISHDEWFSRHVRLLIDVVLAVGARVERLTAGVMHCRAPGEDLPASHNRIDRKGVETRDRRTRR